MPWHCSVFALRREALASSRWCASVVACGSVLAGVGVKPGMPFACVLSGVRAVAC